MLGKQLAVVNEHDWYACESALHASAPFNFAVINHFFADEFCEDLREKLIGHWAWRQKNWVNRYLHNYDLDLPEITLLADLLKQRMPWLLGDMVLAKHWAIMSTQNVGVHPHADVGSMVLNVWLTPDEFNLDSQKGGLVLFDVKRESGMQYHEYNTAPECVEYVRRHTAGKRAVVPYRYNRAVLFDARTFHASDEICFRNAGPESFRINLSLVFEK